MARRAAPTVATPIGRAPRRDALANRARLITAASKVFGEQGTDASLEVVASEAGLGLATIYRRFATKESLVAEVVDAILRHVVQVAHVEATTTDGGGFERWLLTYADIQSRKPGLVARLWTSDAMTAPLHSELMVTLEELLDQARSHRRIRDDVAVSDVVLIIFGLRGIAESVGHDDPLGWRRHLAVTLAGLKPSKLALREAPWPLRLDDMQGADQRPPGVGTTGVAEVSR